MPESVRWLLVHDRVPEAQAILCRAAKRNGRPEPDEKLTRKLASAEVAKAKGYTQVLWLDAVERRYVEEVGTMNIFFYFEDELVTPALSGSILPGITRDSVLHLARSWGLPVSERRISIEEVIEGAESGRLKECFGTGTAAVISPVGALAYKGKEYLIHDGRTGPLARRLFEELTGIQYGEKPDPFGWTLVLS